tara:strand:- start:1659 stop:2045 length:387 start_codon:yes stop_codon:yes gene_type:complete
MEKSLNMNQIKMDPTLQSSLGTQYQSQSADERRSMRDHIRDLAIRNVISVTFVKADGTVREMKCTLNSQYLPPPKLEDASAKQSSTVAESVAKEITEDSTMRVFDIHAQAWRSFRFDRLLSTAVAAVE